MNAPLRPATPQRDFAAALLDPQRPAPPGLRSWNGSDPAARFAVHRNNVVSSLVDALADAFPVVQELVGAEFFRAMAGVFVRRAPPRSPVLAWYGDGFADFIEGFEPARSVAYLADVARLEYARVLAWHAGDAEPVKADAVARALASGEDIAELKLAFHPSVQLLVSRHAVVSIWGAHQGLGDLAEVEVGRAETALVLRPALEVLVLALAPGAADFMRIRRDGVAIVDVRACLETTQGARVFVRYEGALDLGHDGYQRALRGQFTILPPLVVTPTFETGEASLEWLNRVRCFGVGRVDTQALTYTFDVYAVEVGNRQAGAGQVAAAPPFFKLNT